MQSPLLEPLRACLPHPTPLPPPAHDAPKKQSRLLQCTACRRKHTIQAYLLQEKIDAQFSSFHELLHPCNFNGILALNPQAQVQDLHNDSLASILGLIIPTNFNGILALNPQAPRQDLALHMSFILQLQCNSCTASTSIQARSCFHELHACNFNGIHVH